MTLDNYRDLFPILNNYCYLDHAGVGPVSRRVCNKIMDFVADSSETAGFGYDKWMQEVEHARDICAKLIGAGHDEVAFIKSTSHGISIVASGYDWKEGDNIVIYKKEFPSNIYPWLNLQRKGVEIRFIDSEDGRFGLPEISRLTDSRTRLISISSVQYSNGFRADLKAIGEFCSENGVLFLVDAIQSLGVLPIDVKEFKIDFLSADGHKWIMAPEGTGIFYCDSSKLDLLSPSLIGWKSIVNEFDYDRIDFNLKKSALRFEEGSLNVMGVLALGEAVLMLSELGIGKITDIVQTLGDYIISCLQKRNYILKTPLDRNNRGGIISFTGDFDHLYLKNKLQESDIMVNYRGGGIRISPHFYNNEEDIDRLFNTLDEVIKS